MPEDNLHAGYHLDYPRQYGQTCHRAGRCSKCLQWGALLPALGYPRLGEVFPPWPRTAAVAGTFRGSKSLVPVTEEFALGYFWAAAPCHPLKFWFWGSRLWVKSSNAEVKSWNTASSETMPPQLPDWLITGEMPTPRIRTVKGWKGDSLTVVPLFIIIMINILTNYHFAKVINLMLWLPSGS